MHDIATAYHNDGTVPLRSPESSILGTETIGTLESWRATLNPKTGVSCECQPGFGSGGAEGPLRHHHDSCFVLFCFLRHRFGGYSSIMLTMEP